MKDKHNRIGFRG